MNSILTISFCLLPEQIQSQLLEETTKEYITTINNLVSKYIENKTIIKLTSKTLSANLNSAVKNQAIRDSIGVYNKYKKTHIKPILKKQVCIWNNQNYNISKSTNHKLVIPLMINNKSTRISINTNISDYKKDFIDDVTFKRGTLRITKKNNKWIAQISIEKNIESSNNIGIMGVDLGLKIPAVGVTKKGKIKFFGNGKLNKYIRRHYKTLRQKLGKIKKNKKIKKIGNKEQRWMNNQDHLISKRIINFAVENEISTIKLEDLKNIRKTAKTSRKNEKNLHNWSFYRLSKYIEYKAIKTGISVVYVNPAFTSQICPKCKSLNKANDRKYVCKLCGFKSHRDIIGATNITNVNKPMINGKSLSAQGTKCSAL